MTSRLNAMPSATQARVTRRSQIKDRALFALQSGSAMSPTAILEATHDPAARIDEVSRALGEMLADGLVAVIPPNPGSDRRMKSFALTSQGRSVLAQRSAVFSAAAH
jgi:hypothetical protein